MVFSFLYFHYIYFFIVDCFRTCILIYNRPMFIFTLISKDFCTRLLQFFFLLARLPSTSCNISSIGIIMIENYTIRKNEKWINKWMNG